MADNFIFYGNIYESLREADPQMRNDFIWRIVEYGCTGELELTGDPFKDGWLKQLASSIGRVKEDYKKKCESGSSSGRKQIFDREELKRLIAEGKTAIEIAAAFGVTVDAIYHDIVWKERKANRMYRL